MKRLFASDLHLDNPDGRHFHGFERLLENADADEIYLLGDLCEVWIGDDDDGPLAQRFVAALAAAARNADVHVMPGNRDFLFGERFAAEAGVRLLDDPVRLDDGLLLAHGDAFCIDDEEYQAARLVLRSTAWQADVLSRPLEERRALASGMREESRRTNANKADNIMDVSGTEVARVMARYDAHTLIHGHTHRPGIHREDWGTRYVLGAWERCGWYLREQAGRFTLTCVPLPRG